MINYQYIAIPLPAAHICQDLSASILCQALVNIHNYMPMRCKRHLDEIPLEQSTQLHQNDSDLQLLGSTLFAEGMSIIHLSPKSILPLCLLKEEWSAIKVMPWGKKLWHSNAWSSIRNCKNCADETMCNFYFREDQWKTGNHLYENKRLVLFFLMQ